ncbi:MAG: dTDP-4-dehydrorhamnose reductase [Candidatus Marinimicrobia bacterium]|nr:dTDP-4-dehydrorhamnose reductase [Candidatus Neomarinimicrobiota bacterium]
MNILITGADGQLGNELRVSSRSSDDQFIFTDIEKFDITNKDMIESFLIKNKINLIVNCASYTAVDRAEEEPELAKKINSFGTKNLSVISENLLIPLIHLSTDFIFDGHKNIPYTEDDKGNPLSVYGVTKLESEINVNKYSYRSIIIRTSWLYSTFGNNFVKTMIKLGSTKNSIKVVSDQYGSPTYAKDLAEGILKIINYEKAFTAKNNSSILFSDNVTKRHQIYHYSNEGIITWYEFAKAIMDIGNFNCEVLPITTEEYKVLAKRPKYSALDTEKIQRDYNISIPFWKDSLKECIEKLNY